MSRQIRLVGLTGTIAAGKSTAARILTEAGFRVVDADEIAKSLLREPSLRERLIELLGPDCYDEQGLPDHKRIAAIIFSDDAKRVQLEALIHPAVRERVKRLAAEYSPLIYDVPLLFESGANRDTDLTVMIDAPQQTRMDRASRRNGWSRDEFLARERSQIPPEEKRLLADMVIDNDGDLDLLRRRLQPLIEILNASR
jgi:dephospho-CoA kinase